MVTQTPEIKIDLPVYRLLLASFARNAEQQKNKYQHTIEEDASDIDRGVVGKQLGNKKDTKRERNNVKRKTKKRTSSSMSMESAARHVFAHMLMNDSITFVSEYIWLEILAGMRVCLSEDVWREFTSEYPVDTSTGEDLAHFRKTMRQRRREKLNESTAKLVQLAEYL
eukprot:g845.t1